MKLWNKIKQVIQKKAETSAHKEVLEFMCEVGSFKLYFPDDLKRRKERLAYKKNLTETYTYQEGDNLLDKKQDFIDQYTINEREQFDYFVKNNMFGNPGIIWTRAWHNHEQVERFQAQKNWQTVVHRNHREHMRQKFMNQKNR